jgi:hypothetical protein
MTDENQNMDGKKIMKMCPEKDNLANLKKKKPKTGDSKKKTSDIKNTKREGKMRAAFLKAKLWPANSLINIGFVINDDSDPELIPRESTARMKKTVDRNGVLLPLDPMQEEVDDMSIIDAIIYCVSKRFNDVIYPEYKPTSVTIDPNYIPTPLVNVKFNFFDPKDPTRKTTLATI